MEAWLMKVLLSEDADGDAEPPALVQVVLRDAHMAAMEDSRYYSVVVHRLNKQKKAVRDYLKSLRDFAAHVENAA